ncbi:hypothetical protein EDB85DRAFT_1885234 [Lactarius pseudohatsudake]|nr:hypothetical protein EDB85DRAFT_1885234 [Lactarius pseudohatsudake]
MVGMIGAWKESHQTNNDTGNKEDNSNDRNTHDEEAAETFDGNSTPIPAHSTFLLMSFTHAPAPLTMATSSATNALTAGSSASAVLQEANVAAQEATDATRASDPTTATPPAPNDTLPSTLTLP